MPSLKLLNGVAHDIAHHAQSSISWLHPHLGNACRIAGVKTARLDLLRAEPYPDNLPRLKPLEMALQGLQAKFWELVDYTEVLHSAVQSVVLDFSFPAQDDYLCSVCAAITTTSGKVYKQQV